MKDMIIWGKNHPSNLLHIAGGTVTGTLVYLLLLLVNIDVDLAYEDLSLMSVVGVAFAWEFFNMWFRKTPFDFKDAVATILGGLIFFLIVIL